MAKGIVKKQSTGNPMDTFAGAFTRWGRDSYKTELNQDIFRLIKKWGVRDGQLFVDVGYGFKPQTALPVAYYGGRYVGVDENRSSYSVAASIKNIFDEVREKTYLKGTVEFLKPCRLEKAGIAAESVHKLFLGGVMEALTLIERKKPLFDRFMNSAARILKDNSEVGMSSIYLPVRERQEHIFTAIRKALEDRGGHVISERDIDGGHNTYGTVRILKVRKKGVS